MRVACLMSCPWSICKCYRAASLIDDVQMETLSAKTNNINQSPNTKTPQVQDEKQEADKDVLNSGIKAADLIAELSDKNNKINQSPNTKTPQVQDEKQEPDKEGLQKKSLIS